ncbi:hypothetical protein M514_00057 [Trichuris suis]|uniref:Uncharacterized protein n=1 Tax=Trichuris suis TaxID=68888 RepID=A0A085NTX4_9BILA|nr:hypothetical protein M514_00057 [Trichuris suis]
MWCWCASAICDVKKKSENTLGFSRVLTEGEGNPLRKVMKRLKTKASIRQFTYGLCKDVPWGNQYQRMSNIAGVPATYPSVEDPSDSFLSRASITSDFSLNESTACFLFDDALLRAMVLLRMAIKPGHPADSSDSYSSLLLSSVITIHFFMEMVAAFGYNGGGSLASASVSFAWQLVKTIGLSCFYSESCAIRSFRSGAMCVHSDHLYFLL